MKAVFWRLRDLRPSLESTLPPEWGLLCLWSRQSTNQYSQQTLPVSRQSIVYINESVLLFPTVWERTFCSGSVCKRKHLISSTVNNYKSMCKGPNNFIDKWIMVCSDKANCETKSLRNAFYYFCTLIMAKQLNSQSRLLLTSYFKIICKSYSILYITEEYLNIISIYRGNLGARKTAVPIVLGETALFCNSVTSANNNGPTAY